MNSKLTSTWFVRFGFAYTLLGTLGLILVPFEHPIHSASVIIPILFIIAGVLNILSGYFQQKEKEEKNRTNNY